MNLEILTMKQLQEIAKEKGVMYTGLDKDRLVHYLETKPCEPPAFKCDDGKICDLANRKCVDSKLLYTRKGKVEIQEIGGFKYAGLVKDFAKYIPDIERSFKEEDLPQIIIEPEPAPAVVMCAPRASDFIQKDDIPVLNIPKIHNFYDKYNAQIYQIINV